MKRFSLFLIILTILTIFCAYYLNIPGLGIDDANIFFTYGKRIAAGEGIVYTPGGERVEGYSSPLWMLCVAIIALFTLSPEIPLLILEIFILSLALSTLAAWLDHNDSIGWGTKALVVWISISPAFIVWNTITLMDTCIWTSVLVLGAIAALDKRPRLLTVMIILIILTRSEGLVWAGLLLSIFGVTIALDQGFKSALKASIMPFLSYILTIIGLIGGRIAYFGYPWPNTYYAKVSPDTLYNLQEGWKYFINFLNNYPIIWVILIGFIVVWSKVALNIRVLFNNTTQNPKAPMLRLWFFTSIITIFGIIIPIGVGGDHFELFRFYQPIWLFVFLAIWFPFNYFLAHKPITSKRIYAILIMCIVGLGLLNFTKFIAHEFVIAHLNIKLGNQVNRILINQRPTIGMITAGAFQRTYEGPIFDVMGLTDVEVAHTFTDRKGIKNHAAFNREIFYRRLPELMLPYHISGERYQSTLTGIFDWNNQALKGLLDEPQFNDVYQFAELRRNNDIFVAYVRRDYIPILEADGITVQSINTPPHSLPQR